MSYAQLLSSLQQLQLVQLRTLAPPVGRLPVGYDANARCSFHSGAPGHNIENCKAFKHVVQDLIDSKAIDLAPALNVVNNPMPQHGGANVNMIEGKAKSIKDVLKLKTPLLDIKGCLLKADVFPGCGKGCLDCATQSGGCLKLQQGIQALLDKGILQVEDLSVQEFVEGVEEEGFEDATDEFADVVPTNSVIHNAGAVSSTLHQKIKFPVNGRIITVCGEEDILVSNLSTFKYVEVEGEIHETLCQAFESVQIKDATPVEEVKAGASISSFKQARAVVDSGVAPGWGRLLELPVKEDKFGIGYQPVLTSTTLQGPITFSSADIIQYGQVSAVNEEDGDSDCDIDNWVRPRIPGEVINNWSSEEIIQVTLLEECTSPDPIDNGSAMARFDFETPIFQAEEEGDEDCELPEELTRLLKQEERVIQPHQESVEVINLGTEDAKREIKIGAALEDNVKKGLIELLQEYVDIFAWSYQDMPGLDTDIVVHHLPLKEGCPPVKQKLRRTRPEMAVKIKEEVQKQLDAGFLAVTNYPPWVANIVPVPKKDGKVRMCVDYRDLNRASPKDDFPLPHIDVLMENTTQFSKTWKRQLS
ncbi:hypothetical protein KIW84_011900 [Lathyrus oleraceus]|uniref:Gag-pol polyprotein n=1 Tax=Pisum sativum TaxID=3888 RepID=A0A9D5GVC7_PEA|nr:hypothetical protein KIW84_011900 [Pisum sativum]